MSIGFLVGVLAVNLYFCNILLVVLGAIYVPVKSLRFFTRAVLPLNRSWYLFLAKMHSSCLVAARSLPGMLRSVSVPHS